MQVASLLKARHFAFKLVICGSGEDECKLRALSDKLNLSDVVVFRGFHEELTVEMANSDLLVLPSLWEGAPNVAMEAFACGLPCVLSDIRPHRQLAGPSNCAAFFSVTAPEQAADLIVKLANSPDLCSSLAANARLRIKEFSVERMSRDYGQYYRSLLK